MKLAYLILPAILLATVDAPDILAAQSTGEKVDQVLKDLGVEAIRGIDHDICFPATSEEYAAMGKHAILQLRSSSAIGTELPLKAVYLLQRGVRIPLQRVLLLEKRENGSRASQISFYLLPIQKMKSDAQLKADFSGDRKAFGITQFSAKEGLDRNGPAFARLDEYDAPEDADMATVMRVLAREYPDDVH